MPAPAVGLSAVQSARARVALAAMTLVAIAAFVLLALNDLAPNAFHPHGYCYLWQPSIVGLLVISDLSIWLSYTAIAITLAWFVNRGRHQVPFGWVFLAFGAFIVACGMTHLMDVVTLWVTAFWLAGATKALTAVASVATAVALPPLVPKVLALVEAARLSEQRKLELERAVNTAKAEEARFRTLFESSPDALLVVGPDGRVHLVNSTAERFFGYSRAEFLGRQIDSLLPERDAVSSDFGWSRLREQAQMQPVTSGYDAMAWRKDGTSFPVEISASILAPLDGEPAIVAGVRDISERRKAEEQRAALEREKDARAEAEAANSAKDELLSVVSHELRTPLNAILGWTVMLRTKPFDEQAKSRALEVIERNAHVQRRVVDDLLDISRIVAGKLTLEPGEVDVCAVVQAAADSIRHDAEVKQVGLEIACDVGAPLVLGDALRLQQVFWNLLSNAVKFTPAGGHVRVSAFTTESDVRVEVADTGIGIEPDFLPRAFDRFSQHDSSMTRAYGGLGLGLALVRHLVEWHHGQVEVRSEGAGKGARFTVVLPIAGHAVERQETRPAAGDVRAPGLAGVKVLVADDDLDNRELLRAILSSAGARVTAAASGREALVRLATEVPDVLVTDIAMADLDGYELMRTIRDRRLRMPVIALTAHGREEDAIRAMSAGFDAFLAKPVLPDDVLRAVAELAPER